MLYNFYAEEREYILMYLWGQTKLDSAVWPNLGYSTFSRLVFKSVQKIREQKIPYPKSKKIGDSNSGRW